MEISPLTGAETLEQICLYVQSATRHYIVTRSLKARKNVEGIKGRSAVFISPLKTIKRKVKRQRANQLVVFVENGNFEPEQLF